MLNIYNAATLVFLYLSSFLEIKEIRDTDTVLDNHFTRYYLPTA